MHIDNIHTNIIFYILKYTKRAKWQTMRHHREFLFVNSEDMSYPNMGVDTSSGTTSVDHIYKLQWRIPMYLGFCDFLFR